MTVAVTFSNFFRSAYNTNLTLRFRINLNKIYASFYSYISINYVIFKNNDHNRV